MGSSSEVTIELILNRRHSAQLLLKQIVYINTKHDTYILSLILKMYFFQGYIELDNSGLVKKLT